MSEAPEVSPPQAPRWKRLRAAARAIARPYGGALLATGAALLAGQGLAPWLGGRAPLLLLALAVIASAELGGFGPGVVSAGLGALGTGIARAPVDSPALLLFLGVGILASGLIGSLQRARGGAAKTAAALAAREARLRDSIARAPCLLWSAAIEDTGGELLYWQMELLNPEAAERFFPLKLHPAQSYQEAWYWSRLPEDQHRTNARGADEIRAGRSYVQEFRCRGADGGIYWFEEAIQVETIAPGRWRAVGVCTHLTERKHREFEVSERAEQLARADRAKDQFLTGLAHELRSPVGAISNAVHLLKLRASGDPRLDRPLEIIERQLDHQKRMLEDLLDVSRIVSGKISLHRIPLDLTRLLRDGVEDHRAALEQADLTLQCDLPAEPLWVRGDPTRLAQVIGNLLQNAIKFSDPGGTVSVGLAVEGGEVPSRLNTEARRHGESDAREGSLEGGGELCLSSALSVSPSASSGSVPPCLRVDAGRAVITVSDTGIGIEPERLGHLFDSFSQAERPRERSRGGLGLGLVLVKGLVELHGGSVSVHSDGPGQGATFTLHLPLTGVNEPPRALKLAPQAGSAPRS